MSQTTRLPAFSELPPMTDFRQRQRVSTLTAPAAWGFAPRYLVQPKSPNRHPSATETFIELSELYHNGPESQSKFLDRKPLKPYHAHKVDLSYMLETAPFFTDSQTRALQGHVSVFSGSEGEQSRWSRQRRAHPLCSADSRH